MVIGVMGAGAVGSYFGGKLALAGNDVVFVGRGEHLKKMQRDGLSVQSVDGDFQVRGRAVGSPEQAGVCDLILFAVKGYDTEKAARSMRPMIGPETRVLPLQNGVDNEPRLGRFVGPERIISGLCYVGARIDRPGEVIHSAAGRIIVGELDGGRTVRLAEVERLFTEANVPIEVSEEIVVEKWKKFCWNLSFNAVSAVTRARVGAIVDLPASREVVRALIAEAVQVATARGVPLPADLPERIIETNKVFRDLKTSMLQDVEKGRALEVDLLNGQLCRYAEEAGIATPVNCTMYGLLRCLSESGDR